jgi:hypothetical protein
MVLNGTMGQCKLISISLKNKKGVCVAEVVEYLPGKHKALSSNPSNYKNQKTQKNPKAPQKTKIFKKGTK